jgi:glycine cleavage system protein P-like pyridoxal-binding family
VRTPLEPHALVERMTDEGFLAGVPLEDEYGGGGLLVAATEKRTKDEIDRYVSAMEKVIR